jgi:uncharacterized protein YdeI (BOF family)
MKAVPIKTIVGVIISLLAASALFALWAVVSGMFTDATQQTAKVGENMKDSQLTQYEGAEISGSQVTAFLSNNKDQQVCIKVVTKKNTAGQAYNYKDESLANAIDIDDNNKAIAAANKKKDKTYINPAGTFDCTIKRDANDVICLITFTQQ